MHTSHARFSFLIAPFLALGLSAEPLWAKPISFGFPSTWDYIRTGMDAWGRLQDIRGGGPVLPRRSRGVRGSGHSWTTTYGPGYGTPHADHGAPAYQPAPLPPNAAPARARLAPNPLPGHARVPGQIRRIGEKFGSFRGGAIVNPADSEVDLNYVLDGRAYTLPPGHYQDLGYGRQWVIEFHRGGSFGTAKYTVGGVKHVFVPTEKGWELVRREPKS